MSEHFVIDTTGVVAPAASTSRKQMAPAFEQRFKQNLNARYDAAGLTPEMEAWWSNADKKGPRASANKSTRAPTCSLSVVSCMRC